MASGPQAGWYPDPDDTPDRYRWFDGERWTDRTVTSPEPSPQRGGKGPRGNNGGHGSGWVWAIIAVVLIVAVIAALGLRQRTASDHHAEPDLNSSSPTVSAWNEKSSTPSASSSAVRCPQGQRPGNLDTADDRLHGGGVSVESIPNWRRQNLTLPWVMGQSAQIDDVYPGWMSVSGVGGLPVAEGFSDPQTAASMMMSCFASSDYYMGYTGEKEIRSEALTVDGHPAWWKRSEIYVTLPNLPKVRGDVVDVVVVNTGQTDFLGMYFNSATIGDSARQALVDHARESLKVG